MGWGVGEPTGPLGALELLRASAPPVPVWGGSVAARAAPGRMTGKSPEQFLTQMGPQVTFLLQTSDCQHQVTDAVCQ